MNVTFTKLLAGIFALTTAVAGATFAIVKYAKEAEIAAYRLNIEMLDRRIVELQKQLKEKYAKTVNIESPSSTNAKKSEHSAIAVEILSPIKYVQQFTDVRYALTGELPEGFKTILVIRDPLGNWWSWGTTDSSSYYSVQFGTDIDRNKEFEIRIIVTNEEFPPNQPRRSLPNFIASSKIVVTRQ